MMCQFNLKGKRGKKSFGKTRLYKVVMGNYLF